MKAVILAAGAGSRLNELSLSLPKPMINFRGKPILQHTVELCVRNGIDELFINTHYMAQSIREALGDGSRFGAQITYSYEETLQGTAGALRNFRPFLTEPFFVLYGDNYYNDEPLIRMTQTRGVCVIGVYSVRDTSQSGVVEFDDTGRITRFLEKQPGASESRYVNAGVYYMQPGFLQYVEGRRDFGYDVFPAALAHNVPLWAYRMHSAVIPFDTPALYCQARTIEFN